MSVFLPCVAGPLASTPGHTDPYFGYVVQLNHFNGANGSTTYVSSVGLTFSNLDGTASQSTGTFKFGTASLSVSAARVVTATDSIYAFGTNDFTFEFWAYPTTVALKNFMGFGSGAGVQPNIYMDASGGIVYRTNSTSRITGAAGSIVVNTWHHIAGCRSGTNTKLFVNGTQVGSTYTSDSSNITNSNGMCLGSRADDATSGFVGFIDEVRVTKGFARYTANFTAPTAAFPDS
jgi:hypothetical protein